MRPHKSWRARGVAVVAVIALLSACQFNPVPEALQGIFVIEDSTPAHPDSMPKAELVLTQHHVTADDKAHCVVLTWDGVSLKEARRFALPSPDSGAETEPTIAANSCHNRNVFTSDFALMAAIATYRLPDGGNDSHVGVIDQQGAFHDLSGRNGADTQDVRQKHPAFGLQDRLYYWQYEGAQATLNSVASGGSDTSTQGGLQNQASRLGLIADKGPFYFMDGIPVNVQYAAAVAPDHNFYVKEREGQRYAGTLLAEQAPQPVEGDSATPIAFLQGAGNEYQYVGVDGNTFYKVSVNPNTLTTTRELIGEAAGESTSAYLGTDGANIFYTTYEVVNDVPVTRLHLLPVDGDGKSKLLCSIAANQAEGGFARIYGLS